MPPKMQSLCEQIMREDIAVVSVKFENHKYVKTIMDKRISFADQLASLCKISLKDFVERLF
jgi:hypothetical protein